MKKLIIAAAASIAAVGAFAAVESANVVGYNSINVARGGYVLASPQFKDCAETTDVMDLAKLITTDAPCIDMSDTSWEADGYCATIMVKTSEANPIYDCYYYCYDSDTAEPEPATAGWWKGDLATPLTDKLALGRGAWFVIPNDDTLFPNESYKFTFSGATADLTKGISVPVVNKGYTIAANPFPTPITGANITVSPGVSCVDMETTSWEADGYCATIMVKTSQQNPIYDCYYYCYDSDTAEPEPAHAGWWKGDLATEWSTPIAAGQAFWIVIPDGLLPDDKQTFTFSL